MCRIEIKDEEITFVSQNVLADVFAITALRLGVLDSTPPLTMDPLFF